MSDPVRDLETTLRHVEGRRRLEAALRDDVTRLAEHARAGTIPPDVAVEAYQVLHRAGVPRAVEIPRSAGLSWGTLSWALES